MRSFPTFALGSRKAFIDRLNARRQAIHGQLAELALARRDLGLASDFATPFFARDTRNRELGLSDELAVAERQRAELAARVAALRKQTTGQ